MIDTSANYKSCFDSCTSFSISPPPFEKSYQSDEFAYVTLLFDENEVIKVYESYYIYSGLSMIAEIGGYVGLFLGISVNQETILMDFVLSKIGPL